MSMAARALGLALGAFVAGGALPLPDLPPHTADAVTVTVNAPLDVPPLPSTFVGLSMEVPDGVIFLGAAAFPNKPFAALMNTLRRAAGGGAGPTLRIGGGSADTSVYWEQPLPLPPNQTYAITRADLEALEALEQWNGSAVLDTNFWFADNTTFAAAHARGVTDTIGWGRIDAVEVGNEVDAYHDSGMRPSAWSVFDYEREFAAHVTALEAAGMPHGRVQGAVFCCNNSQYNREWPHYVSSFARDLASISHHWYGLHGCGNASVTIADLLADAASADAAAYFAPLATAARAAGVPMRLGEGNTVNCGGRANVSDVFASALWAVDILFEMGAVGVSQVNFHGGPNARDRYTAISFDALPSTVPHVRPLFYGMWAAATAAANSATPLAATVHSTNAAVKVHALRDSAGVERVVVVHKDFDAAAGPATVTVVPSTAARGRGAGSLVRLVAPGNDVLAKNGITFAGQTFDGSINGEPVGTHVEESVPVVGGSYVFSLPPLSVAILAY